MLPLFVLLMSFGFISEHCNQKLCYSAEFSEELIIPLLQAAYFKGWNLNHSNPQAVKGALHKEGGLWGLKASLALRIIGYKAMMQIDILNTPWFSARHCNGNITLQKEHAMESQKLVIPSRFIL